MLSWILIRNSCPSAVFRSPITVNAINKLINFLPKNTPQKINNNELKSTPKKSPTTWIRFATIIIIIQGGGSWICQSTAKRRQKWFHNCTTYKRSAAVHLPSANGLPSWAATCDLGICAAVVSTSLCLVSVRLDLVAFLFPDSCLFAETRQKKRPNQSFAENSCENRLNSTSYKK